jgi:acyl dehydratase
MADIDHGARALLSRIGEEIGVSEWFTVDQLRIDVFGAVTDDLEPLHNDPAWCQKNSPYKKPIAYGFLTISMLTRFLHDITSSVLSGSADRKGFPLNYGFDRVRFIEPVLVGSRIRAHLTLTEITDRKPGTLVRFSTSIEIENVERPALTAEWLTMWVDDADAVGEFSRA